MRSKHTHIRDQTNQPRTRYTHSPTHRPRMSKQTANASKRKTKATTSDAEKELWEAKRQVLTDSGRAVHVPDSDTEQFICKDCGTINEVDPASDKRICKSASCKKARHERAMRKGVHPVADADHRAPDSMDTSEGGGGGGGGDGVGSADAPATAAEAADNKDDQKMPEEPQAKKGKPSPQKEEKKEEHVTPPAASAASASAGAADPQPGKAVAPLPAGIVSPSGYTYGRVYNCVTESFKKDAAFESKKGTGFTGMWWAKFRLHPSQMNQRDLTIMIHKPKDDTKYRAFTRNTLWNRNPAIVRLPAMWLGGAGDSGLFGNFIELVDLDEKEKAKKTKDNLLALDVSKAKVTYMIPVPPKGMDPDIDALRAWFGTIDRLACHSATKVDEDYKKEWDNHLTVFAFRVKEEDANRVLKGLPPMTEEEKSELALTEFMKTNWRSIIHEPKTTTDSNRSNALEMYGSSESFYASFYVCTQHFNEKSQPDVDEKTDKVTFMLLNRMANPKFKLNTGITEAHVGKDKFKKIRDAEVDINEKLAKWVQHPLDDKKQPIPLYMNVIPCRDGNGNTIPWSKRGSIGSGCKVSLEVSFSYVARLKIPPHLILNIHAMRVVEERQSEAQTFDASGADNAFEGGMSFKGRASDNGAPMLSSSIPLYPEIESMQVYGLLPEPAREKSAAARAVADAVDINKTD
jgi:hypothetical protein